MNDSYIAILDSGLGGLAVLNKLIEKLPNERFLYYGDGVNAPYGNRSVNELYSIALKRIEEMSKYPLKAVVLACNTLSVNVRAKIENSLGIPVFGVFPSIEKYIMCGKPCLLLATERTAEKFINMPHVDVVGLKTLARDIEYNMFNMHAVDLNKNLTRSVGNFVNEKGYYNAVILGCTHYIFIRNKILDHFCPKIIEDSTTFTIKKVKEYIINNKSLVNHKGFDLKFIGEHATVYKNFCVSSGQEWQKVINFFKKK